MQRKPRQRALGAGQIALVKAYSVGLVRQPEKMDHTGPDQHSKAEETGDASMQVHQSHRSLHRA
jgi:hypothetical protein